ncbi:MAG: phosphatidate cytidylyltransferase [Gammaproteobacteria bacterium]
MLRTRFITAFALGLPAMWLVFQPNQLLFWWFLFIALSLGMWEWTRLAGLQSRPARVVLTAVFSLLAYGLHEIDLYVYLPAPGIFMFLTLWWLGAMLRVARSPGTVLTIAPTAMLFRCIEGIMLLLGLLLSLQLLHAQPTGSWLVLTLLFLIWGADSVAYFSGRKWGKTKLLPRISPGKTWAGVVGGLIGGTLVSASIFFIHPELRAHAMWVVPVIVVSILFSVLGDLFESMYKRAVNLKDSSQLLPGHGGILDRIDSLLAAAPVFVCGLMLVGVIA